MRGRYLHRKFDDLQLDWFESELADDVPTIICSHFPIKTDHFKIWCKEKDLITPKVEARFFSIIQKHKNQVKGIFVGHGHRWIDDELYEQIPVYEAKSFGDFSKFMYYIVGFDHKKGSIKAVRNPIHEGVK
jgi:hypothetical protein